MTALVHFAIQSNGIYSPRVQENEQIRRRAVQSRDGAVRGPLFRLWTRRSGNLIIK